MRRLGVVPHDLRRVPHGLFSEQVVQEFLNPLGFFDEVFFFVPFIEEEVDEYGLRVIPTTEKTLCRNIIELKIDLVRAHGGKKCCDWVCNNKVLGVPVMVSTHDERENYINPSIAKADAVLYSSAKVKRHVLRYFKNEERLWHLPAKVDFRQMKTLPSNPRAAELDQKFPFKYKILQVGRKAPEKNINTLMKAVQLLGDDFCLVALGRGSLEMWEKLQALAASLDIEDRCFLHERVPHDEVSFYMNWATCVCNPSHSEGHSRAILEALACEAVVVTSAIESNEYLTHGVNALCLEDTVDYERLARLLKEACVNKSLREKLSGEARAAAAPFEKRLIDQIEVDYFKKLMER